MSSDSPKTIYLKDYSIPNYKAETTYLEFDLHEEYAIVTSRVKYVHNTSMPKELKLDGNDLELVSVAIDGVKATLSELDYSESHLFLKNLESEVNLEVVTKIYPQKNTSLEGLYKSAAKFCTQCEAQGFRKITYYQDRPDVMSVFTTKIIADKSNYPVLLSNGNELESGSVDEKGTLKYGMTRSQNHLIYLL